MKNGNPALRIMGLAPVAVLPERQRQGVGSALVRAGLEQCRQLGAVVVLGHHAYYPRFGFSPSTRFGIGCEYDVPADAFMVFELHAGFLRGASGKVRYQLRSVKRVDKDVRRRQPSWCAMHREPTQDQRLLADFMSDLSERRSSASRSTPPAAGSKQHARRDASQRSWIGWRTDRSRLRLSVCWPPI
jgi:predicted acetyltransferase